MAFKYQLAIKSLRQQRYRKLFEEGLKDAKKDGLKTQEEMEHCGLARAKYVVEKGKKFVLSPPPSDGSSFGSGSDYKTDPEDGTTRVLKPGRTKKPKPTKADLDAEALQEINDSRKRNGNDAAGDSADDLVESEDSDGNGDHDSDLDFAAESDPDYPASS